MKPLRILVNAVNVTGAGARGSTLSFLPALCDVRQGFSLSVLLPDQPAFRALPFPSDVEVLFFPRSTGARAEIDRLGELYFKIPRIARQTRADVCLTLGDFGAVGLPCPQVVMLRQPLLVYDDRETAGLVIWHPLKRLYLSQHFARVARRSASVVVQTPVMAERVASRFGVERQKIVVIPQALSQHVAAARREDSQHPAISICEKPKRLLFLAAYYPHKNHAILPAVVGELERRGLESQVHIFLTVDQASEDSPAIRECLRRHSRIVTNLGALPHEQVAAALRSASCLFLPTLVESYGNIYLEALACGRRVLTSDRDFARWMCRDLALYFDPLDARSIVDSIEVLPDSADDRALVAACEERLATFPRDWGEVALRFADVLRQCAQENAKE